LSLYSKKTHICVIKRNFKCVCGIEVGIKELTKILRATVALVVAVAAVIIVVADALNCLAN